MARNAAALARDSRREAALGSGATGADWHENGVNKHVSQICEIADFLRIFNILGQFSIWVRSRVFRCVGAPGQGCHPARGR
jgi:hypothetical protein